MVEGRVKLNGDVTTELGTKADPETDIIEVDGVKLKGSETKVYFLLYKPRSVISAVSDPRHRKTVSDIVKCPGARLFPVGRLDYDAEGVILMTNDGEITEKLIHPKYGVEKTYLVKVKGVPDKKKLARLCSGVRLEDGFASAEGAHFVKETSSNSWIELTLTEGRNHIVKRMCLAIGHPVMKLRRIAFAGITLWGLSPGKYRALNAKEVARLKDIKKPSSKDTKKRRDKKDPKDAKDPS